MSIKSIERRNPSEKVYIKKLTERISDLNLIDFALVSILFFRVNDKILKSKSSVQQKMFYKLLQESKIENDPEKVIFNFFKYVLSNIEKKLLAKGLNFCLPPKQLKYVDYLVHFELFIKISVT